MFDRFAILPLDNHDSHNVSDEFETKPTQTIYTIIALECRIYFVWRTAGVALIRFFWSLQIPCKNNNTKVQFHIAINLGLTVNSQMNNLMRLWHFSSSVNAFFKRTRAAIQWARRLIFGRTLRLLPHFMCANSEGSGESTRMRKFACAFAGRLCDKYPNLMSWRHFLNRP